MPLLKTEWDIRHNRHICHVSSKINGRGVTGAAYGLSRHLSRASLTAFWPLRGDTCRDGRMTHVSTDPSRGKALRGTKKIAASATCDGWDAHFPHRLRTKTRSEDGRPGLTAGGGA